MTKESECNFDCSSYIVVEFDVAWQSSDGYPRVSLDLIEGEVLALVGESVLVNLFNKNLYRDVRRQWTYCPRKHRLSWTRLDRSYF